jgi:hypothetical protein
LQGEALRLAAEAILGQELLAVEPPDLTEPARIDGIGFIIAQRIFHAIEPARDQGIVCRSALRPMLPKGGAMADRAKTLPTEKQLNHNCPLKPLPNAARSITPST